MDRFIFSVQFDGPEEEAKAVEYIRNEMKDTPLIAPQAPSADYGITTRFYGPIRVTETPDLYSGKIEYRADVLFEGVATDEQRRAAVDVLVDDWIRSNVRFQHKDECGLSIFQLRDDPKEQC